MIFDTIFVMLAVAAAGVLADDVKVIDVACGGAHWHARARSGALVLKPCPKFWY